MAGRLRGKVALVVGAGSGMGRAGAAACGRDLPGDGFGDPGIEGVGGQGGGPLAEGHVSLRIG